MRILFSFVLILFLSSIAYAVPFVDSGGDEFILASNVTVNSGLLLDNLTNDTVFLNMSFFPDEYWDNIVQSDCGDTRITNTSNVEQAREMVWCNITTKEGEMHLKASSLLNTVDRVFTIYSSSLTGVDYDFTDEFGRNAVWQSYLGGGVWHLQDTGSIAVSSTGTNNGTIISSPPITELKCYMPACLDLGGGNDRINLPNAALPWGTDTMSLSTHIRPENDAQYGIFHSQNGGTQGLIFGYAMPAADRLECTKTGVSQLTYSNSILARGGYIVGCNMNNSGMFIYVNGTEVASNTDSGNIVDPGIDISVGSRFIASSTFDRFLDGSVDEIRIGHQTRNRASFLAEMANAANHSSFLTYGPAVILTDPCAYSGSGDHVYNGTDACVITEPVNFLGNAVSCTESGSLLVSTGGRLFNFSSFTSRNSCFSRAEGGNIG